MNAYDIEIEYDQENDNYYAEHEFTYPSKRVRLNIDTDNSLWPTDESNSMTITIPSNPQTDTNNTWDDTTKTLTLTNLDQNSLITNNQNPNFNYATDLNINLLNYQPSTPSSTKINIKSMSITTNQYGTKIPLSDFTKPNNQTFTIPAGYNLIKINKDTRHWFIYFYYNQSSNSINKQVSLNDYCYLYNRDMSTDSKVYFFDEINTQNNTYDFVFAIFDENFSDSEFSKIGLNLNLFNLIFE